MAGTESRWPFGCLLQSSESGLEVMPFMRIVRDILAW
jgi:hypothetical protein